MAEKLQIDITAQDNASGVIDELASKVEGLEKGKATVTVGAEDQASATLDQAQVSVDALDGASAEVAVGADDEATGTLEEVATQVDGLDGASAEVAVSADDEATGPLEAAQEAVDALDGAEATATVTADDEATPVIQEAASALDDFDGREAQASLSVDDQASGPLDQVSGSLGGLGQAFSAGGAMGAVEAGLSAIGPAGAAAAGGIAAAVATVGEGITKFQDLAIEVDNFSTKTGASLDASSRLVEVAKDLNTSVESVEGSIGRMNRVAEKSPGLFDDIGASIVRNKDGAIDSAATFESVVSALGKIPEGSARTTAGFAVMGKGWANMSEFVGLSAEELRARLESVSDVKIITPDKVNQAHGLRDAFDTMSDAVDDFFGTIGQGLAPAMTDLANIFGDVLQQATPLAKELGGDMADALISLMPLFKAAADAAGLLAKGLETTVKSAKIWGKGIYEATQGAKIEATNEELGKLTAHMGAWADAAEATVAPTEEALAASAKHAAELEKTRKAYDDTAVALKKWTDDLAGHFVKVGQATQGIHDLNTALTDIGGRESALANVFKLGDGPRNAASNMRDIQESIGGLSEAAKGVKIGDVIAGNVKADKLLDAIDKLAPQIQSAITTAFGAGGPEAATAMANSYIDQVTKELGGKFTREQVAQMLGLDHITAVIEAAVTQASIDKARRKLQLLVGITGSNPWTATIELAMDAGELSPDAAQALIDAALRGQGVVVPVNPQISDAEFEEARKWLLTHPGTLPIVGDIKPVEKDSDEARAHASETATMPIDGNNAPAITDSDTARAYANRPATMPITTNKVPAITDSDTARAYASRPAVMPIDGNTAPVNADSDNARARASGKATMPVDGNTKPFDDDVTSARNRASKPLTIPVMFRSGTFAKGGTVGPYGGIAGEAGKEFAQLPDGRVVLLQSETPVPPGTRVTSARRTRQILSGRRRYANGTGADGLAGMAFTYNQNAPVYGVEDLNRHLAAWSQQLAARIGAGRR